MDRQKPGPSLSSSRRRFTTLVAGGVLSPYATSHSATAQSASRDVTPAASPVTRPGMMTREEYYASIREAFPFEEPAFTGGQVILVSGSDISTLNPHLVIDGASGQIAGLLYEWLIGLSPIDGRLVPGLADSWAMSEDGLTYTFHLHRGARWHDGESLTAEDVIFSLDAVTDEQTLSPARQGIIDVLASYRKIDDYTIELVARDRIATFMFDTVAAVPIVPKHIWGEIPPGDWGSSPGSTGQDPAQVVGSGPFRFVEWEFNDHVTLARHDDYWDTDSRPVVDEFVRRVIVDPTSRTQSLITGDVDISFIAPSEFSRLKELYQDLTIVSFDNFGFTFYMLNLDPARNLPATDIGVRQALMYALDRDVAAESIYDGLAVRADGTQPVLSMSHDPERISTIYTYQPDMARRLLDEAGWAEHGADGIRVKDGDRFSFELFHAEGSLVLEQLIPYLQQRWREIGVEMIPLAMPFPVLLEALDRKDFDAILIGFSWDITGDQGIMYRCDAVPPNGFNSMSYCNPRYDELDDLQRRELDREKRIDLQIQLTNIVNDEQANSVLFFGKTTIGFQPRVHNYFPGGHGEFWSLPFVWVDQAGSGRRGADGA